MDDLNIPEEKIIASLFDIDARVYPDYFGRLTYCFLDERMSQREAASSQFRSTIIIFGNRRRYPAVVATSGTFWHMMQQERPERLATFSAHAMSWKALKEVDFLNTKNVSEDSRIFWKSLLFYDGDYQVVPLFYPISMDAALAPTFLETMVNVYRQQRRWGWGSKTFLM